MWYPARLPAPTVEPVTLEMAKEQTRVLNSDEDAIIARLAKASRAYCEAYTGQALGERTVTLFCDSFDDLARLPVAPVGSITAILYEDQDGIEQAMSIVDYEVRIDGMIASVVLLAAAWPATRAGSRIEVTATVGGDVADDVLHAMLLHVAEAFAHRENGDAPRWSAVDCLLVNHRFYA